MRNDGSTRTTDAGGTGVTWVRRLVLINLSLVALEALSAGLLMSGYARALAIHGGVAAALQLGALAQAATALLLWRRRRVAPWVASVGVALLVMVFLQAGLGYRRSYWLHVPIGVGIFGGLTRQIKGTDSFTYR